MTVIHYSNGPQYLNSDHVTYYVITCKGSFKCYITLEGVGGYMPKRYEALRGVGGVTSALRNVFFFS